MSEIRQFTSHANSYFVTCKTAKNNPLLIEHIDEFKEVLSQVHAETPFNIIAWVLLPDHFHMVLEIKEDSVSTLLHMITDAVNQLIDIPENIWNTDFFVFRINNQNDLNRCINYTHYNPVYHEYTAAPVDWQYSSFDKYYKEGLYPEGWGVASKITFTGEYGE